MPKVTFVGLGLNSENGMSLEGREAAQNATSVFAEFYTNTMPNLNMNNLEQMIRKPVNVLARSNLEDENGQAIISASHKGDVVLLVPGDPMVATTHVSLRLNFLKQGIDTRVVHAASIISAVCGATGLQNYKFGRSVTIPSEEKLPTSVINSIRDNKTRGLHTLVFLDVRPDDKKQLTIVDALSKILKAQPESAKWLAVGLARVGGADETVHASRVDWLLNEEFGSTPHILVFPSALHFMEAEALKVLGGAREEDLVDTR